MVKQLPDFTRLGHGTPPVRRLGLATRGNTHLTTQDVLYAVEQGINCLNWCGHPDGMSRAIQQLSAKQRKKLLVVIQFSARTEDEACRELEETLQELGTDYIDVITLYYVERETEWDMIAGKNGALKPMRQAQEQGIVRLIGMTTHQRKLAAKRAQKRELDLLMVRYNAAHRGAEQDVFPISAAAGIPVITFTGVRWGALTRSTPEDPPGFSPPTAQDCYRFVLSNPMVAVGLMAPNDRAELEADLKLLECRQGMTAGEMESMRAHGDRVHRTGGGFP